MLPSNGSSAQYRGTSGIFGTIDAPDQRAHPTVALMCGQARAAISTEQQLCAAGIAVCSEEGVSGVIERISVIGGDEVQTDVATVAEEMEWRHP